MGADPDTGLPMVVKDGRFGPYVTDGTTNASLRRGDDVETLTVERAAELLAERRAAGPPTKQEGGQEEGGGQEDGGQEGDRPRRPPPRRRRPRRRHGQGGRGQEGPGAEAGPAGDEDQ